jgi:hypothetical protein
MKDLIPFSVPDIIYRALQLRSEWFHAVIAFLRKTKCYEGINLLRCKRIVEPCPSWVNWLTGQHRRKLKSARTITQNRLIARTKLSIEQFFKTFEDLIKSSVFKDVNRPIAIAECNTSI